MKLRTKLVLSFLFCLTLSSALFMFYMQRQIVEANQSMMDDFNSRLITQKSQEIGGWLQQRILEMRIMSESEEFKTMDWADMKLYTERLNRRLQTEYGNPAESFGIVDMEGKGWIHEELTIDVSQRPYFLEARETQEEYVISDPVISKSDHNPIMLICYPIYGHDGNKVGFINGSLSIQKIEQMASNIRFYDGTGFVINDSGQVFRVTEGMNPLETPENFQKVKESGDQICIIEGENGKKLHVLSTLVPFSKGWRLGVVVSDSAMYAQVDAMIRSVLIIWLVILAVAVGICILLGNGLTRPLIKLEQCMKEVERGNLEVRFPTSGASEFSRIGVSFNHMLEQIQGLILQVCEEQQEKRSKELQVLQSQINPHFLYNTLDTIRWKAYEGDTASAVDMIDALSDFFRISLSSGDEWIPLKKEVEHVSRYLFIQKIRYEEKLEYEISVEETLKEVTIIKLLIQPLVENAIYHGIKPLPGTGKVRVLISESQSDGCVKDSSISDNNRKIMIVVEDNGIGMKPVRLKEVQDYLRSRRPGAGYGLYNVNERICLTYGDDYGVTVEPGADGGTKVTALIPYIPADGCERGKGC